jgi:hypothetical protein
VTSREKVLDAERQIREIVSGDRSDIDCPFCNLRSEGGQMLCCNEMATVTHAVLDHIEHIGRVEAVERMFDRLEQMRAKAVLN